MTKKHSTLLILLVIHLFLFSCKEEKTDYSVQFDQKNIVNDHFEGFGVQWSTYIHADAPRDPWGYLMKDPKRWQFLFQKLDYMQPSIIRILDNSQDRYFRRLDNNGIPVLSFDRHEMHALYRVLDYCQRENITVILGEWNPSWQFNQNNYDQWVEMIGQFLHHLIKKKKYTCIKYYTIVDAPNTFKAKTQGDWEHWKEIIEMLHQQLNKKELNQYVKIMGPSSDPQWSMPNKDTEGKEWLGKTQKELHEKIGAYDIHAILTEQSILNDRVDSALNISSESIQQLAHPLFITEYALQQSDSVIHDGRTSRNSQSAVYTTKYAINTTVGSIQLLNDGADAIVAWNLDDAMFTEASDGNKSQLIRWGMFNSLGDTLYQDSTELNNRPWYYTWSWMSKYIPKGSRIIKMDNKNHHNFYAVGAITLNNEYVTLMVNLAETSKAISVEFQDDISELDFYCFEMNAHQVFDQHSVILSRNTDIKVMNHRNLYVKMSPFEVKLITTEQK
ncbi:hypothetical protein [Flammeovirga agarivorans]|uniref:Uncharacterized protein n=1 Tax=Flammeovirga agarivorans TaxID=2726742 RepID=A0A7X8SR78_9BACT|nr:hypothetical protein [Flammeovirga agarivorans]NLR94777.1 hypothetical protein [Flammeovirga agarivorans]